MSQITSYVKYLTINNNVVVLLLRLDLTTNLSSLACSHMNSYYAF